MSRPRDAISRYDTARRLLLAAGLRLADTAWQQVRPSGIDATWAPALAGMLPSLVALQVRAAEEGGRYVTGALAEQGIDVEPAGAVQAAAFAGVASDGRPLDTLLLQPPIYAKTLISQGAEPADALAAARDRLRLIVATQLQDAGRQAVGVAIAARPRVGWVRQLNPPSCSRCAILAGKTFKWNQGFLRHPGCDCTHIPAAEDVAGDLTTDPRRYFDSLDEAEQDRVFTKAGAQAIRDGADLGQVVDARRGLTTTAVGRQRIRITTEGTTVRSYYGRQAAREGDVVKRAGQRYRSAGRVRLMPEQIYLEAGDDRDEALRLLRRFGYL